MTACVFAYGLQVTGLPDEFPCQNPIERLLSLEWTPNLGLVASRPAVWATEGIDRLTVGWANYAEFDLVLGSGRVDVRYGSIGESEAAFAFLLSVLPLAMPLFEREPMHCS